MKRREIRPTQSGELRHVCNIEQLIEGTDATGAPLAAYQLWAQNVFYAIDDWKPYEAMQAAQLGNQLSTRFRIRWRPGVVESMRLVINTTPGDSPPVYEYYDIVGAVRDIYLRVELQLTCVKRTSPGFRTGITENVAGYGGLGNLPTVAAAGPPVFVEQVAAIAGAQTIMLPRAVVAGWSLLYINGLSQDVTNYSVSGSTLSLPSQLNVLAGDLITFVFYPTT